MHRGLWAGMLRQAFFLCFGLSCLLLLGYAPSVSAQEYYFIQVRHSGKCLHQHGGTFGNGDPITQWDCVNEPNVILEKVPAGGNAFFLRFAHSGKCAHLHGDLSANGTPITQWDCVDLPNVKWREEPAGGGYVYVRSASTNKCLHQHGGTFGNGDPITQWDCVNEPNVQWRFTPIPGIVHRLQVRRFTTTGLSNAEADRILADAMTVLRTNDGPDDVVCPVTLVRNGDVTVFADGDGSIDSGAEFTALIGLPGHIKAVNQINWCGSLIPNVIGCAPVPGNSLAVVRFTSTLEGILWAHEFGHNKGRGHRDDSNAVMNGTIGSTRQRINSAERDAFLTPTVGALVAATVMPHQSGAPGLMDIRDFVRQVFIHGVPYQEASRYDASVVPMLLGMLNDPAAEAYWPNIVVVLGMIGDERAVEPLISFIEADVQGVLSREHYAAKTSAMMALGYLINKTGNQRALTYLTDSVAPETWAARGMAGTAPFQASTAERNRDFSKHAILGLALSGRPEAAQALRSLQQPAATETQRAFQAQVSDLVSEALQEHQRIATQGLENYYRTTQP